MAQTRRKKKPDNLKLILAAIEESRPEAVRAILSQLHPADIGSLLEDIPQ